MNATKITFTATILVAALGIVLGLMNAPAQADCPHRGNFEHKHCEASEDPPEAGQFELAITFEFGDFSLGCTSPDCVTTQITAVGGVGCINDTCDFNSTEIVSTMPDPSTPIMPGDPDYPVGVPEGVRTLVENTMWRGEELDLEACFRFAGLSPSAGVSWVRSLFMRSNEDGGDSWRADVRVSAFDVNGNPRNYTFNAKGPCVGTCPTLTPSFPSTSVFDDGELTRIDGQGPDRKLGGAACRCTSSNTPDCPNEVTDGTGEFVPIPPIRFTVTSAMALP